MSQNCVIFCFKVHFLFHTFAIRGSFAGSSVNPSFIPQLS